LKSKISFIQGETTEKKKIKGFLYGSRVRSFDTSLKDLFDDCPGLADKSKKLFIKRFELNLFKKNKSLASFHLDNRKIINMYLSQITSINNSIGELVRYNLIRLYLIKTHRGRAQALGKPSRGQRT
jgi:ribosomal protein S13